MNLFRNNSANLWHISITSYTREMEPRQMKDGTTKQMFKEPVFYVAAACRAYRANEDSEVTDDFPAHAIGVCRNCLNRKVELWRIFEQFKLVRDDSPFRAAVKRNYSDYKNKFEEEAQ